MSPQVRRNSASNTSTNFTPLLIQSADLHCISYGDAFCDVKLYYSNEIERSVAAARLFLGSAAANHL